MEFDANQRRQMIEDFFEKGTPYQFDAGNVSSQDLSPGDLFRLATHDQEALDAITDRQLDQIAHRFHADLAEFRRDLDRTSDPDRRHQIFDQQLQRYDQWVYENGLALDRRDQEVRPDAEALRLAEVVSERQVREELRQEGGDITSATDFSGEAWRRAYDAYRQELELRAGGSLFRRDDRSTDQGFAARRERIDFNRELATAVDAVRSPGVSPDERHQVLEALQPKINNFLDKHRTADDRSPAQEVKQTAKAPTTKRHDLRNGR